MEYQVGAGAQGLFDWEKSFSTTKPDRKIVEHTKPITEVTYGQKQSPQYFQPFNMTPAIIRLRSLTGSPNPPQARGKSSLNAIEPGDKLISAAGGSVTLYVGLRSAVHRVEHDEAVLGSPIVSPEVCLSGRTTIKIPVRVGGEKWGSDKRLWKTEAGGRGWRRGNGTHSMAGSR